jgi:hypothetical protein
MKAELDEKGTLVIWAETPVESFALTHWHTLWNKDDALLLVNTVSRSDDGIMDKGLTEVKPR